MKRPIPTLESDAETQDFVDPADLTDYDLSGGNLMRFELRPKDKAISLRLPEQLLEAVREHAERAGIPYQRYIRVAIEQALRKPPK